MVLILRHFFFSYFLFLIVNTSLLVFLSHLVQRTGREASQLSSHTPIPDQKTLLPGQTNDFSLELVRVPAILQNVRIVQLCRLRWCYFYLGQKTFDKTIMAKNF